MGIQQAGFPLFLVVLLHFRDFRHPWLSCRNDRLESGDYLALAFRTVIGAALAGDA